MEQSNSRPHFSTAGKMSMLLVVAYFLITNPIQAQQIPLEHFTKHGDYLDLKLSPDGAHIAARIRQKDTIALLFFRRSDRKMIGGVKPGAEDVIHSVTWVNNERVVFEKADKQFGLDRPVSTGELFATNIDSKKRIQLYGYRASDKRTGSRLGRKDNSYASQDVLSIMEGDDKHILIIEYPWRQSKKSFPKPVISKLNIYNGRKRKIETVPHYRARAVADKQGNVHFISWRDENRKHHSAFRKNQNDSWEELNSAFGVKKNLRPFALNNTLTHAYMHGYEREKGLRLVYELNIETGEYVEVFDGLTSDIANTIKDIETGVPVVAVSYPDKYQYHYAKTSSKIADLHKALVKSFPGQEVSITSKSKDGQQMLVHVRSDINPGEYYVFDTAKKNADFLWANRSWIDPSTMHAKTPITFSARDGVDIHGYLTLPALSPVDAKPPLVVMLHGGPHGSRDDWSYDSIVQLFASRGYAVLQPNFRGSGGYGKKFEEMGYRQWGGTMVDDMIDATKWVVDQGHADSNRICTYGASYGGYASLMSAVRAPDLFECSVGYVGVYDLDYMYSDSDVTSHYGGTVYIEKIIGRDQSVLDEFSPINHVDKIKAKIMLIHGEEDKRVSVKNTNDMAKKLKKMGKPARTLLFDDSAHGVYDANNRRELYKQVLEFLDDNIGQ